MTASSEHALGGHLIEWRRGHASVCPEWPRWAEKKGLRLDERGALLYPNEEGPYEPRIRPKSEDDAEEDLDGDMQAQEPEPEPVEPRIDLMLVAAEDLEQTTMF